MSNHWNYTRTHLKNLLPQPQKKEHHENQTILHHNPLPNPPPFSIPKNAKSQAFPVAGLMRS